MHPTTAVPEHHAASGRTGRILIVDDDEALSAALSERFVSLYDFETTAVASGARALEVTKGTHFDLIILDVNLPDHDGRDLCRLFRRKGVTCPIIVLTGLQDESDEVLALESGATDYVTKPFPFRVLQSRVRAHLRQSERLEEAAFRVGPYLFRPAASMLLSQATGARVALTPKETALLKFLLRSGPEPVSADVLLREVWDYTPDTETHTVQSLIYRLRQKIESDPSEPAILVTDRDGYRLAR